jgi:hypothetical protein
MRNRSEWFDVSFLGGCDPQLCGNIQARITDIAVRATPDIQPASGAKPFQDHEQEINTRVKDLLKEKLKDDFNWKQIVKTDCGSDCHCKKVLDQPLEQGKGRAIDYDSDVKVYVDKEGKIDKDGKPYDSGTPNISCTVKYKITIFLEFYGTIGICLPGAQKKWL